MGRITEIVQKYHDGSLSFEELKSQLVEFPWKEPEWSQRMNRRIDRGMSMTEAAMKADEELFDPEDNTLEELDSCWADELLTEEEFTELQDAIYDADQDLDVDNK